MKKLVSLFLAMVMLMSMTAFADEAAEKDLFTLTTEEITLRYCTNGLQDIELTQKLADQFMEQYPNIKVEVLEMDNGTYADALGAMAGDQNLPDVFWTSANVCDPAASEWALNVTEYWNADPDIQKLWPNFQDIAQLLGERFALPMEIKPIIFVLNKTLFEQYNVELPAWDWNMDEFVTLIETLTHPEDHNFGFGHCTYLEYFGPYFGWDGESYTFDDEWVWFEESFADWNARGWAANAITPEEREAWYGTADCTAFSVGHAAINPFSFNWEAAGYVDGSIANSLGCEFVIYPSPSDWTQTAIEWGCISKGTKYPNEAWELMKWMGWGEQAARTRIDYDKENEILSTVVPAIRDEALTQYLVDNSPEAMAGYYQNMKPLLVETPDFMLNGIWVNVNYYLGGIPGKFNSGELTPSDYAATLRADYNKLRDQWIEANYETIKGEPMATATDLDVTTGTDAQ